jgi:hypothetical protein
VQDALLARTAELVPAAVAADLGRLRATIARQQRFFLEAATLRLADSPRARRLVRRRLRRRTWPLGAEAEAADTAMVLAVLFDGDEAWAHAVDRRLDAVPGLAGLRLVERSATHPGRPGLRTTLRRPAASMRAGTTRKGRDALPR